MTLIHAAFKLADMGLMSLHKAIRLVTLNPAIAVGIHPSTGSLEEGKAADFIIVNKQNSHAQVIMTFVAGQEVFSTCLK
jgi:alpha-D-ribose 1-methylphosphonate 5-triphosphate diphosphatase